MKIESWKKAAIKGVFAALIPASILSVYLSTHINNNQTHWKEIADRYATIVIIFFGVLAIGALLAYGIHDWIHQRRQMHLMASKDKTSGCNQEPQPRREENE